MTERVTSSTNHLTAGGIICYQPMEPLAPFVLSAFYFYFWNYYDEASIIGFIQLPYLVVVTWLLSLPVVVMRAWRLSTSCSDVCCAS
jgi:hypothetical protein